eukprot:snap_masked-scaffold91_size383040-processed-gene-1.17 protein:Tk03186 transcript:snap_masked-scaffold91_size383040-processed-gene-1.17-mRNA-1 annotation:"Flotillin-1 "
MPAWKEQEPSNENEPKILFELDWLEDCHRQVALPNPKCEDLCVQVNEKLRKRVRGEFDNEIKQQAMFQLLGEDYVRINFPRQKFRPLLLDPPKTRPEIKEVYINEMKGLLDENMAKSFKDLGYPREASDYEGEDPLGEYAKEIRLVFQDALEDQVQQRTQTAKEKDVTEDVKDSVNPDQPTEEDSVSRQQIGSMITGEAFVTLISKMHDIEAKEAAVKPFKDKSVMLPSNVTEKASLSEVRKQFRNDVNKKINLSNLQRAVQSSDYRKIYSVIIDSYHTTKVVQPYAEDEFMLQAAHVLNVCNVMNKNYSNANIFHLIALQLVYPRAEGEKEERTICRLACDLHLMIQKCLPSWSDVFKIADDVMKTLAKEDEEYARHLEKALSRSVRPVDVYDFAYEILHEDTKMSIKIWNDLYKKKKDWKNKDLDLFSRPAIYLRKWIAEAFAGIIGKSCLLYTWDLLFLNKWSWSILRKITLAILVMIKPWAMCVDNHKKLSRVLLEEPSKIYMGDFRATVIALMDDTPLSQIHPNSNAISATPPEDAMEGVDEQVEADTDKPTEDEAAEVPSTEAGDATDVQDTPKEDEPEDLPIVHEESEGGEETPEEIEEGAMTEEPTSVAEELVSEDGGEESQSKSPMEEASVGKHGGMCSNFGIVTTGPDEVLIISGVGYGSTPKIIEAGWSFLIPGWRKISRLSMNIMTIEVISPRVYTSLGVAVSVTGVAQVKINGANEEMLRSAAEQFGTKTPFQIKEIAKETLEGHQRAIMGGMTVEDIYRDRKQFSTKVFEVASTDLFNLGIQIISYTIKDIQDDHGYLMALGESRTAQVQRDARIGEAEAQMESTIAEAEASELRMKAELSNRTGIEQAKRDFEVKRAIYDTEVNAAKAEADLAYQLQAATTRQKIQEQESQIEVVERTQQIQIAEQEIQRKERELDAKVRKPAEAEKYRMEKLAEANKQRAILEAQAEAEAQIMKGEAEAFAIQARAKAEAEQMAKKADAWSEYGEAAKVEMLMKVLPRVAAEVAAPLAKTKKITMVSDGSGDMGASKITSEIMQIMTSLPAMVNSMTGVDIGRTLKSQEHRN